MAHPDPFHTKITLDKDDVYQLVWRTPVEPVINVFVDPDGTEQTFPEPESAPHNAPRVVIKAKYGANARHMKDSPFRKNRTAPDVEDFEIDVPTQKVIGKEFKARFIARWPGIYEFEAYVESTDTTFRATMTVKQPPNQRYDTIQEVMDDRSAVRRQAILASVFKYMPSFNNTGVAAQSAKGLTKGTDTKILNQGEWVGTYYFNGEVIRDPKDPNKILHHPGTSCTTVNPGVMRNDQNGKDKTAFASNDASRWAFGAGPQQTRGKKNPAWVDAKNGDLPSVGDTYIVFNNYNGSYGHVGIVLHVPPGGNGLWVTADGGQGGPLPTQLAIFVSRWGIMSEHLPKGGDVSGVAKRPPYKSMKPEPGGPVFLSGNYNAHTHHKDPKIKVPEQNGDIEGMKKWIVFNETTAPAQVGNPRRLHGFVNIDDLEKLNFEVDGKGRNSTHIQHCADLKVKVQNVILATLDRGVVGGKAP